MGKDGTKDKGDKERSGRRVRPGDDGIGRERREEA